MIEKLKVREGLIIDYRLLTKDFETNEMDIINKSLKYYNTFKALGLTPEQELKLIKKIWLGEIKLDKP